MQDAAAQPSVARMDSAWGTPICSPSSRAESPHFQIGSSSLSPSRGSTPSGAGTPSPPSAEEDGGCWALAAAEPAASPDYGSFGEGGKRERGLAKGDLTRKDVFKTVGGVFNSNLARVTTQGLAELVQGKGKEKAVASVKAAAEEL